MVRSPAMAVVKPFRAVRYDEDVAGPLDTLVAPPYDVIDEAGREELMARSPFNVVHLTLPEDENDAARLWSEWQSDGVVVREDASSFWALGRDYVGPDGVPRTRRGLVASLRPEPYENRVVLPHERTHAGPKEGRLRLLRATGIHFEPIFLLYDGEGGIAIVHGREGELDVQLVESLAPEGVSYTPSVEDAVAAVDSGRAAGAFIVRPTRIDDVFRFAEAGETLPQKTTYFYPKLLSGLLFH